MDRNTAMALLKEHNKEPFHIQHALTVSSVLSWFSEDLGFSDEKDFWYLAGLLHDIDFEEHPESHCDVAPEWLRNAGYDERFIHAVASHGYGHCKNSPKPEHLMEKVLFATDELTGLIGAAALMRPSKSVQDMELKSLKKKFKDKSFAAGCSREVIQKGAEMLGWELDTLLAKTLDAMKASEGAVAAAMAEFH